MHGRAGRTESSRHCGKLQLLGLLIILSTTSLYIGYASINGVVEKHVFKGRFLHNYWESFRGVKRVRHNPENDLLVFQHVPRTAADAMQTHLFGDVSLQRSSAWNKTLWELAEKGSGFISDSDRELANNASTEMIKGIYSHNDLTRITRLKCPILEAFRIKGN